MTISKDRILDAARGAIASRGRFRGMLKAKCPPGGADAALFWQAAQLCRNPYKVSIGRLLWLSGEEREFWNACVSFCEHNGKVPGLTIAILDRNGCLVIRTPHHISIACPVIRGGLFPL